jgi:DNA-binding NarL/FixJ family response regulator
MPLSRLSARQQQVFTLLDKGWLLKEIAAELGISINTVKAKVRGIRHKCGDAHNARAAIYNYYAPRQRQ